jgi:hypothetical protein
MHTLFVVGVFLSADRSAFPDGEHRAIFAALTVGGPTLVKG